MEIGTVNFDDLFDFSPEPPPPAPEPLTSGPEPLTSGPEPSGHRNTLNAQDVALLARMQHNSSKDYYTLQPQHQLQQQQGQHQQQQQQQQHQQQQQQRMEQGTSAGGQYNSSSYNASRSTSQSGQVGATAILSSKYAHFL
jgi:hypothetical protein